jgi:chromosome segregation protein
MGPVNPLAVQEHAEELKRLDFLTAQRTDLVEARDKLQAALTEIDTTARAMFLETFAAIRRNFQTVFLTLFDGGDCDVSLSDENDPRQEIEISASPRGKRTQRINLLSSGERALVAISLLFSIYLAKPSPFCLLDEVDAPLDDANVARFIRLLSEFKDETQFIVITHNPRTMQVADAVYGVTMQEPGVSTIVGVRLGRPRSASDPVGAAGRGGAGARGDAGRGPAAAGRIATPGCHAQRDSLHRLAVCPPGTPLDSPRAGSWPRGPAAPGSRWLRAVSAVPPGR